jgi:hypothetical protein
MKAQHLILGAAGVGIGVYAYKQGILNPLLKALGIAEVPVTRTVQAAITAAPTPAADEKSTPTAPREQSEFEEEDEYRGGGGFAGGGGGGGGAYSPAPVLEARAPSAPVAPALLQTGMLMQAPGVTALTPQLSNTALQTLISSTIRAQQLSPLATQMSAVPQTISVNMPRPGIIAARAAFPIMTPALAPTSSFQSALLSSAQRSSTGITGIVAPSPTRIGTSSVFVPLAPTRTSTSGVFATARLTPLRRAL